MHVRNPYKKNSFISNLKDVFGDNPLTWLCPVKPTFIRKRDELGFIL